MKRFLFVAVTSILLSACCGGSNNTGAAIVDTETGKVLHKARSVKHAKDPHKSVWVCIAGVYYYSDTKDTPSPMYRPDGSLVTCKIVKLRNKNH